MPLSKLKPLTDSLIDYHNDGKPVNNFLVALLSNELYAALESSEGQGLDIHDFRLLVEFIQINLHPFSYGSKENIMRWYRKKNAFFKSGSEIELDKAMEKK